MPDLKIHREHSLGLAKARKVAWQWAEEVERKFDMECTVVEGEYSDTVQFTRSGHKHEKTADHEELGRCRVQRFVRRRFAYQNLHHDFSIRLTPALTMGSFGEFFASTLRASSRSSAMPMRS